jgi:hypothetical protein
MAERIVSQAAQRRAYDDDLAEVRLAKARERIRKNFPDGRAPLHWRRDTPTRMVSSCGRFAIEKHGDGEAARYTAKLLPHSIIANRRYTLEQAKEDCNRHASPLPLEGGGPAATEPVEREPGSDDE